MNNDIIFILHALFLVSILLCCDVLTKKTQEEVESRAAAATAKATAAEDLATRSTTLREDIEAEKHALHARVSELEEAAAAARSASATAEPAPAAAAGTRAEEEAGGMEAVAHLRARCEELELEAAATAETVRGLIERSWDFRCFVYSTGPFLLLLAGLGCICAGDYRVRFVCAVLPG